MDFSPRLSLSYLAASQAQKHVTVNESLRRLDAVTQLSVLSSSVSAEPASPAEGDCYILPAGASGAAWSGMAEGAIAAYQDGAWVEIAPGEGWRAWISDDARLVVFNSGSWAEFGGESASKFGVNTTADATNRLAVKSDAVLLSHDDVTPGSGDMRVFCNKATSGDTASFLFQDGFSGRAEFGLTGDDDFRLKVSADGASWANALTVSRATGDAKFEMHACVARSAPSDFWGGGGEQKALWLPYGYFGTNGSYGLGLWYNGYRSSSSWSSQGINGSNVGAGIELQAAGCLIRYEDNPSSNFPAIIVRFDASTVRPGSDNTISSGSSSNRWTQVYAASGTINTSDARDKDVIGALSEAEKRAARRILSAIVKYRWNDAVAEKGESARLHVGVTAQEAAAAFAAEGLDAARYGLWCEDEIVELVDDPERGVFERPTGEKRQGLRYDELLVFLIAAMAA